MEPNSTGPRPGVVPGGRPTVMARRPMRPRDVSPHARLAAFPTMAPHDLLPLLREVSDTLHDEARLLEVVAEQAFRAFPEARRLRLETCEADGTPTPRIELVRAGALPIGEGAPALTTRAITEGIALWCAIEEPSRTTAAIVAPILGPRRAFGALRLDGPGAACFSADDLDRLAVVALHAGLALEHQRMERQARRAFKSTMNALVKSLTLKDPGIAEHSERVQVVAIGIGRVLGLHDEELEALAVAALLHDLGKQGVRDEVLFKPARLDAEERAEMDRHAAHTRDLLDAIEYPDHLRDVPHIAAWHHEKLDGSGPMGVQGDAIPLATRIIAVADVFDALVSPRVYKAPMTPRQALDILERGRGADWDGVVIDALHESLPALLELVYGLSSIDDTGFTQAA